MGTPSAPEPPPEVRAALLRVGRMAGVCVYVAEVVPGGLLEHFSAGLLDGLPEHWRDAVHPDDAAVLVHMRAGLVRGETVEAEYRIVGPDRMVRVLDRARPRAAPGGRLLIDGLLMDVSSEDAGLDVDEALYALRLAPDGGVALVAAGGGWARVLGAAVEASQLLDAWTAHVHPADVPAFLAARELLRAGEEVEQVYRLSGLDGRERHVRDRAVVRRGADGVPVAHGLLLDVTGERLALAAQADVEALARQAAESAREEGERRLRSLVDAIDDVVLGLDLEPGGELHPVLVGAGLGRLLGGPLPARADPLELWRAALHPDDRAAFAAALRRLAELAPVDLEHRVIGIDGVVRTLAWRARPRAGEDGHVLVEGILTDVSSQRRALRAAERAHADAEARSRVDALTGVPNRRALEEAVAASRAPLGLVLVDVDHFKRINDTHGHGVGDEVLIAVAARLTDAVRGSDLVARVGGEEFCVLLPGVPDDRVLRRIADGLRVTIEQLAMPTAAGPLAVTASLGAARGDGADAAGSAAVLEAADAALYAAKRRGRNRAVLASDLTAGDRVAEDPPVLRIARALGLAAGDPGAAAFESAVSHLAIDRGLSTEDVVAARALAWLRAVDPAAVAAVPEVAVLLQPGAEDGAAAIAVRDAAA